MDRILAGSAFVFVVLGFFSWPDARSVRFMLLGIACLLYLLVVKR